MSDPANPRPSPPDCYTSIIYFHGMGTPKRYEELSRILETLDRYGSGHEADKHGALRGQSVGVETSRVGADEPINFLRFGRIKIGSGQHKSTLLGRYRLYENYWSPAAAGAVSAIGVFLWFLTQAFHPFSVLCKPWRAHQRLKRAYLSRMFYDRGTMPALRFRQLAKLYRDFEGLGARRQFFEGRFRQFQRMISERYARDEQARRDLQTLAFQWRNQFLVAQIALALLSATLIAGAAGLAVGVLYLGAFLTVYLGAELPSLIVLVDRAGEIPAWVNFAAIAIMAFFGFQLRKFLELFLSDVVFWTTTFEKDVRYRKRREILAASEDILMHVIADAKCDRIVVVGHSLGTAIAYQTLLDVGRRMKASRESGVAQPTRYDGLRKISHFITLGSPIDRINYFFQLTFSRYHRFNRVADELMGRSSDLPFKMDNVAPNAGRQIIRWINVRDPADPIASRLFSPRGTIPNRHEIQEVSISSSHVPSPGGAHTGYFESELAAKILYDACILGRETLQLQTARPAWSHMMGNGLRRLSWGVALSIIWSIVIGAVGYVLGSSIWMTIGQSACFGLIVLFTMIWLVGGLVDRFHDLTLAH
ncbi:hypothetical protein MOK15_16425 [Sphingobium sp. BYY-5]|uniref:hypothetical protein n=1 Tax=Sphingobium sp. BYY-5 TaxID=2926400 RepID=UPI001FA6E879|nr:hypothetical protein [Sphingobium sp. BYY-5]MCI4591670.1 hypothetical protein [Sphingobium sp. BYY-5]